MSKEIEPFALMLLTAILAGLAIPIVSILMAWVGLVEPFCVRIYGRTFNFNRLY